jgi:hypothetical protein
VLHYGHVAFLLKLPLVAAMQAAFLFIFYWGLTISLEVLNIRLFSHLLEIMLLMFALGFYVLIR